MPSPVPSSRWSSSPLDRALAYGALTEKGAAALAVLAALAAGEVYARDPAVAPCGSNDISDADGAVTGVHWEAGSASGFGEVAETYAVLNERSGISTSPLGFFLLRILTFSGSGISTSPFGFWTPRILAFSGSGISTSPLGFFSGSKYVRSRAIEQPSYTSTVSFGGEPLLLSSGSQRACRWRARWWGRGPRTAGG